MEPGDEEDGVNTGAKRAPIGPSPLPVREFTKLLLAFKRDPVRAHRMLVRACERFTQQQSLEEEQE